MPDLSKKKSNHVSNLVTAVVRLLEDVSTLKALTQEARDLHYDDPDPGGLADADFAGANAYLDAAIYKQVLGTLLDLDARLAAPGASGAPSVYAVLRQMKP